MSDEYYRQRAARRGRMYWIIGGVILVIVCVVAGVIRSYQDSCTGSFDRSPQAVIESYTQAVLEGDVSGVTNCWQHDPFFETDTGCSEMCLSKVYGSQFQVNDVEFGESYATDDGRLNMDVRVSAFCQDSDQNYTAEITLDTVGQNYPWKHWHIVYSTFGGTVTEPWCK
ncbi:MAG: hypothetical protein IMY85_01790 [Chloroflexi bacterium]|nr:hypothetical protein [Chloroflexota bacterium]